MKYKKSLYRKYKKTIYKISGAILLLLAVLIVFAIIDNSLNKRSYQSEIKRLEEPSPTPRRVIPTMLPEVEDYLKRFQKYQKQGILLSEISSEKDIPYFKDAPPTRPTSMNKINNNLKVDSTWITCDLSNIEIHVRLKIPSSGACIKDAFPSTSNRSDVIGEVDVYLTEKRQGRGEILIASFHANKQPIVVILKSLFEGERDNELISLMNENGRNWVRLYNKDFSSAKLATIYQDKLILLYTDHGYFPVVFSTLAFY